MPKQSGICHRHSVLIARREVAIGAAGIEPATSCSQSKHSTAELRTVFVIGAIGNAPVPKCYFHLFPRLFASWKPDSSRSLRHIPASAIKHLEGVRFSLRIKRHRIQSIPNLAIYPQSRGLSLQRLPEPYILSAQCQSAYGSHKVPHPPRPESNGIPAFAHTTTGRHLHSASQSSRCSWQSYPTL